MPAEADGGVAAGLEFSRPRGERVSLTFPDSPTHAPASNAAAWNSKVDAAGKGWSMWFLDAAASSQGSARTAWSPRVLRW